MRQENLDKIIALRHDLHAHPELSLEERWTKAHVMDFLSQNAPHLELVDMGRWFYALRRGRGEGPAIGFRADMDALPIDESGCDLPYASTIPGVAHKCGHDGHTAALAGLGLELEELEPERDVILLFQHAEEIGAGARETVDTLLGLNIGEFYAFHSFGGYPEGAVLVREGTMHCASVGVTVEMTGTVTHASTPELGNSPALPLARLACALSALAAPANYEGLVLCTIVHIQVGRKAFGTAPDHGELSVTVRAERQEELDDLVGRIEAFARQEGEKNGLTVAISHTDDFPETRSDSRCVQRVRRAARTLGMPILELPQAHRASEDFGHILRVIPGCAFGLGDGVEYPTIHDAAFNFPDAMLEPAVELYKELITSSEKCDDWQEAAGVV